MNNKKRQRLPKIKPTIKQLIVSQAIRYREKPRITLANELQDEIERMGEVSPSEETLMKMISDARNKETSPLDKPWHMGTLGDIPLPSEAIPYILKIKKIHTQNESIGKLTIRQAIWISRLYATIKDINDLGYNAYMISVYEIMCSLSKTPFDTSEFDDILADYKKGKRLVFSNKFVIGHIPGLIQAFGRMGMGNIKKDGEQ